MKYTKEPDISLRGWEFFREDEEGGEVAKGVSFSVISGHGGYSRYPLIPLQKLILPNGFIKYIVQEFGAMGKE